MSERGIELYVYYRVATAHRHAAVQAVRSFQQRLCSEHPGLTARVLQRSAEPGDDATLMEIYRFDDGVQRGVGAALQKHIEHAAVDLTPLLRGPRQIEQFDALD